MVWNPVGGGGDSGTEVAAPALRISRKKGSLLRPPHVHDFVKEGYFFVPGYEVWGVKIPLQSTNYTQLWRRVTPKWLGFRVCCRHLLPLNRQRIIKSEAKIRVPVHPMSVIKEGVFIYWKKSAFLSKEGCFFWQEISALGVFSNFDNERMRPPLYLRAPPPPRVWDVSKACQSCRIVTPFCAKYK